MTAADAQLEMIPCLLAQLEAAALLAVAVAVECEAAQQAQHMQRQQVGLLAALTQRGGERWQVDVLPVAVVGVGGLFT